MANQDFNVLGNQRGKIGNVVGYVRKGKQCYRGYVAKVKQSKSEESLIAKARFAALGRLGVAFRGAVSRGFQRPLKSSTMTAVNIFVKKNKNTVTAIGPDSIDVDFGAIVVSQGNLPWVEFGTPRFDEEAEVSVTFATDSASLPGGSINDKVYLFVYQPDTNMGVMSLPASRSTGSITVAVPSIWSGMKVHLYGFAMNNEEHWDEQLQGTVPEGETSPSTYVGTGTIA